MVALLSQYDGLIIFNKRIFSGIILIYNMMTYIYIYDINIYIYIFNTMMIPSGYLLHSHGIDGP